MKKAIYIGTFDPIHITHIEVLRNARINHENVKVIIYDSDDKTYKVDILTRFQWVKEYLKEAKLDVQVVILEKKDFKKYILDNKIDTIIRRLRKTTEISKEELRVKKIIHSINEEINIHYIVTGSNLSSGAIRRMIRSGNEPIIEIKSGEEVKIIELVSSKNKKEIVRRYNV